MYKSKGKESLPVLLQKIETELVLDRAAKRFSKAYPSCPLFSVHDALSVESSHAGFCSEILKQEALSFCGLNLKLKEEVWNSYNKKVISIVPPQ